jgi:hypothetical protein
VLLFLMPAQLTSQYVYDTLVSKEQVCACSGPDLS